jgi:DNA-binding XRE family transcriptional regulator
MGRAGPPDRPEQSQQPQQPQQPQQQIQQLERSAGQEAVLVAARQEVSGLRDVFVAIQDALEAALERLEGLESQLEGEDPGGAPPGPQHREGPGNGLTQADGDPGGAPSGRAPGGVPGLAGLGSRTRRGTRPIPLWKLASHRHDGSRSGGPGHSRGAGGEEAVTGESLRARREALGISQAAVAHAAHCSRGLVAEVERGKRRASQTLAHLSATLDKLELQLRRP